MNQSAMKLLTVVLCLLLLINCKPEKKPPTETAADSPETPELIIEDPFSGTNLVDNIKLVDLNNEPIDLKQYQGEKDILKFLGNLV